MALQKPNSENDDKMKNLAGETKADLHILKELEEAGVEVVEGERSRGEVPYTLTGQLADWNFSRAWYYWMANAENGKGLPLEVATELHNRKYPVKGERQPKTYGQVIRVAGHAGCPPPEEWATKTSHGKVIDSYHVDAQWGLNALAGVIRTLHNMASSGTADPKEIKRLHDKISSLYVEWETDQQQDSVEWLKKLPTIAYDDRTVTELLVAIKDESEIASIAKKWKDNQHGLGGIAQHFFKAGQITGFNYGNFSGPGQILNRGPEIDERLRPHYEELKTLRPNAADSLEHCMQELEKPGPEYRPKPDFPGE